MKEISNVEKYILNVFIKVLGGVSLIIFLIHIIAPETDILALSFSAAIFLISLTAHLLRNKNPTIAAMILAGFSVFAMAYNRILDINASTPLAAIMIIGFVSSVLLKGNALIAMHIIIGIVINAVFTYNLPTRITSGITFSVLYFLISYLTVVLKNSYDKVNMHLKNLNADLNEKSNEITVQNEELLQQSEELETQRDLIEANFIMLETQNQLIKTSIRTALTIQKAILPQNEKIQELLREYFVLYKPKDVVSGDFYWIAKNEKNIILIVADCTGHGVPGAFMTLIGSILLDKIVNVLKITSPDAILTNLHQEIQQVLKQNDTGNNYGMDAIALNIESISDTHNKIIFAGAKNDLYYMHPLLDTYVQSIKATRNSIGGEQNNAVSFENKEVLLNKGTIIYACTDGFVDQNDRHRKRFGFNKLSKLIAENIQKPLQEQEQLLEETLQAYMEGTQQRDDILVLGFKL